MDEIKPISLPQCSHPLCEKRAEWEVGDKGAMRPYCREHFYTATAALIKTGCSVTAAAIREPSYTATVALIKTDKENR